MNQRPQPDRRAFLGHALAAVAAGSALRVEDPPRAEGKVATNAGGDRPIPIVDTHQHLWDLRRFKLPWIAKSSPLDRDFLPADYRQAAEGLGIVKTVYMEVDVEPSQQVEEAEYVIRLCREEDNPMAGAVISGRPESEGFAAYLRRFRDCPEIKGVRRVLHSPSTPPGHGLQPDFLRGLRQLGDAGLSFDLCMRPAELRDAARMIDECPETRFILDHCGNASVRMDDRAMAAWRDDVARVAERPNVSCKVSGIVASAAGGPWTADDLAPIIDRVLDSFGPDRVVFGGDWPVCTLAASLAQWVEALRQVVKDRPEADRRKLFHDNALRVYRLS